jgi:hypothetical protein
MKKYEIKTAFSLLERVLVVEGDVIYAEAIRKMHHVYSAKTRKRLGTISSEQFLKFI